MGVETVGHKLIEVMGGLSKLLGNRAAAQHKGAAVDQKAAPAVAGNSSVHWNNSDDD